MVGENLKSYGVFRLLEIAFASQKKLNLDILLIFPRQSSPHGSYHTTGRQKLLIPPR